MAFPCQPLSWVLLCAASLLLPASAAEKKPASGDLARPRLDELRQLRSMLDTVSFDPLVIRRLRSRYPIWAVRVPEPKALLGYIGSAALWIDLSKDAAPKALSPADDLDGDGTIDGRDIEAGLRRKMGEGRVSIAGAQYELDELVDVANQYAREVSGKTVKMPGSERELMERLVAVEAVVISSAAYKARQEGCVIFITNRSEKGELEHELTHALYSFEPDFRDRVARIWESLPEAERRRVRTSLGRFYGLKRHELLLTEFAAFGVAGFSEDRSKVPPMSSGPLRQASRQLRKARAAFLGSH
ncbi:MAG: hypothetical protein ABII00_07095 [Elusimicrobiota bacterium]